MLFLIEREIAKATPTLLQLGTKEKLLEFLTSEPESHTWLWTNKNGANVGYLTLIDKEEHGELEVLAIRILPGHQKSGYGKEMMAFAEKIAKKKGRAKVTLVTNIKNTIAIGFYKGLGYKVVKEIANYFGDGENRYLLVKEI
ncbi:MAG: GNAT family N-acetyltransferase [Candidatus Micrarchaeales archaeon]|nr:GNAT family N-acetyltransferase [Candidatus Micrarchaeales archaeon]